MTWVKLLLLLCKLLPWLNRWLNEHTATKRLEQKDGVVDSGIDRLLAAEVGKQPAVDETARLSAGGAGGTGVGAGQLEDNKSS